MNLPPILTLTLLPAVFAVSAPAQTVMPDLTGNIPEPVRESRLDSLRTASLSSPVSSFRTPVNKTFFPRVFTGYRHLQHPRRYVEFPDAGVAAEVAREVWTVTPGPIPDSLEDIAPDDILEADEQRTQNGLFLDDAVTPGSVAPVLSEASAMPTREELSVAFGSVIPDWLRRSLDSYRFQQDFIYSMMIDRPSLIEYAYWDLPEPPQLPEEDYSLRGYLKRLNLPKIEVTPNLPVHANGGRINWLHTFGISLQLSQSYLSDNWYQGGTSHLAFFGSLLWDVQLNQVYYPKMMFQSTFSYKLAINSTPEDEYHRYNISQDLLQYNLKAGYKALNNWYYSITAQFKTQLLNNYPSNSPVRSASFLSPGELNVGLGMTYNKENAAKTLKFSASIAPLSYNLKICIDPKVDHEQFGIRPDRKWLNEIGSNAEVNFMARLWGNTTYTTRLFFFTDYKTLMTDWENTLNFQFSRLFSTQIYAHLRYDTSADSSVAPKWGKLMLKEILSIGISYNFSTK